MFYHNSQKNFHFKGNRYSLHTKKETVQKYLPVLYLLNERVNIKIMDNKLKEYFQCSSYKDPRGSSLGEL